MLILRILAYLIGGFGVIGTLLPFLTYDDYWIRGFDYPRQQLIFVLVVAVILWIITNTDWDAYDFIIAAVLVFCAGYQTYRVLPYSTLWPLQSRTAKYKSAPATELSLMVANVLQTNRDYGKVIDLAKEKSPDLLLLIETDEYWDQALHPALDNRYPYHIDVPLPNYYGMHFFSKIPLEDTAIKYRIKDSIPSIDATVRLGNNEPIQLYFLHPMPPTPTEAYASTGRDAELAKVGQEIRKKGGTTIVAGDMNDVAWSHSTRLFQRLSGLLDPRRGRGFYATFHADHWFARWPLDHVFHSKDFAVTALERLPHIGSDHFPVYVKFNYEPQVHNQEVPTTEKDDLKEAKTLIERGKAGDDNVLMEENE